MKREGGSRSGSRVGGRRSGSVDIVPGVTRRTSVNLGEVDKRWVFDLPIKFYIILQSGRIGTCHRGVSRGLSFRLERH